MNKAKKICFDKILERDLKKVRDRLRPNRTDGLGMEEAIAIADKRWLIGSTIKIFFLEGTDSQIAMVKKVAIEWTEHANLTFEFVDDRQASDIRIGFDINDGSWSYIGTDNLSRPNSDTTLNLAWVDKHVILHEFGHMIGLSHEHQNPEGGIQWNEEVVFNELAGSPNFWDEDTVHRNILKKYSRDILLGTTFDSMSIMLYSFSPEWTLDGFSADKNETLSIKDKDFIKSKKMYPPKQEDFEYQQLFLGEIINAFISKDEEQDVYKLVVKENRIYTILTLGTTDTMMALYGDDDKTKAIADNDDTNGLNSMIEIELEIGEYYIHVVHHFEGKEGKYKILVASE